MSLARDIEAILERYVQNVHDPDDVETIEPEDGWRLIRDLRAALNSQSTDSTSERTTS